MSCPDITRQPSMRKVVTSTFISTRRRVPFLACTGRVSAFLYHNLGLAVSGAAHSFGVPLSQYIDDRHLGQLLVQSSKQPWATSYRNAEGAAYILCYLLMEASYFVNLSKSQCTPSTSVTFLSFICDSIWQAFLIPEEKKVKFKVLRENVLASKTVMIKTLQHFAGKAVSFSLAIGGCQFYLREIFKAVTGLVHNSKRAIKVTGLLQSELEHWRFLDDWLDCLPWRLERHITATLYCDASKRVWGGVLMTDNGRVKGGDYWREDSGSINFLEARALLCALDAFKYAWEYGGRHFGKEVCRIKRL